jgi:NodT family efflux transporter outer membrane factor (OMF) lipoprotein
MKRFEMKRRGGTVAISLVTAILLGGCAHNVLSTAGATASLDKEVEAPRKFVSSFRGGKVDDGWLRTFHDPVLNRLVSEAQKNNPDLTIAAGRVAKAYANMRITYSGTMPSLDLRGNYSFRSWEASKKHDRGDISLSLSWEPDLWGRVANELQRDSEETIASIADYEWARQSLSASTAKAWFLLGADSAIYRFSREVVRIQKEAKKILEKRAQIGQGNSRDVHLIGGMLAEAMDTAEEAKIAMQQDSRALETLIGRYPSAKLSSRGLKALPPRPRSGVPLELLNRRADIIAAKYEVAAAFHNSKAVDLLRLPSIDIRIDAGADVIQNTMAKLIGGLFMPIFDAGRIDALVAKASADQQIAIARYKKTVLSAYREVEEALYNEKRLSERYRHASTMVREYKKAYDLTYKNYKIGQGTLLDVLNVQTKWINARILETQILKERLVNRVNLHLALGGSFESCRKAR